MIHKQENVCKTSSNDHKREKQILSTALLYRIRIVSTARTTISCLLRVTKSTNHGYCLTI